VNHTLFPTSSSSSSSSLSNSVRDDDNRHNLPLGHPLSSASCPYELYLSVIEMPKSKRIPSHIAPSKPSVSSKSRSHTSSDHKSPKGKSIQVRLTVEPAFVVKATSSYES
jgi:hypothetical protein